MSYNDRETSKDWEDRLKDFYIKQDDLNRLIMDYLVNGCFSLLYFDLFFKFVKLILQRALKKQLRSFKKSLASNLT